MKNTISLLVVIGLISGCSAMSKLTVKEYTASSGQKVAVGRYKPEADNQCKIQKKLSAGWGFNGKLDPDGTYNDIVRTAVARAPSHHANYVYVVIPTGMSSEGSDVSNSVAYTYYYNCKNPPG